MTGLTHSANPCVMSLATLPSPALSHLVLSGPAPSGVPFLSLAFRMQHDSSETWTSLTGGVLPSLSSPEGPPFSNSPSHHAGHGYSPPAGSAAAVWGAALV